MSEFVFFDNAIQPFSDAKISAVSAAANYGRGIFTTLAVKNEKPFLWHLHEKRLRENAAKIKLNIGEISFVDLLAAVLELIAANRINNGRARITLFDAASSRIWNFSDAPRTAILIVAAEQNKHLSNNLNLAVSPFLINSTSPLAGVKSCNYLENLLALENARRGGFDEAVRVNERGEIVSATMANVFWIKNEIVFTPALQTGALAGTTREFVINSAAQNNIEVREVAAEIADLTSADEIFLTSARLEICAVKTFANRLLPNRFIVQLQRSAQFG